MNIKKAVIFFSIIIIICAGALIALYQYEKSSAQKFDRLISTQVQYIAPKEPINPEGLETDDYDKEPSAAESRVASNRYEDKIKSLAGIKVEGNKIVSASPKTYIVGFFGDQGLGDNAKNVLRLAKSEGAEALVLLGDYDYADNPQAWIEMIETELGNNFPIIPVIGNHDEKKWKEYSALLAGHLSRTPDVVCKGDLATQAFCSYKNLNVIVTAPGIASIQRSSAFYADFIKDNMEHLIKTKELNTSWNICAWHKNQKTMQLGQKNDETGWDTYNTCLKYGLPVMTAHEHSYSRTYLLSSFENPSIVKLSTTTLATSTALAQSLPTEVLKLSPGKSFAVVSGLGGQSVRPQAIDNPWWSSAYTSNQNAKRGGLFCAFNYLGNEKKALCYFKNVEGAVIDTFVMER